MTKKKYNYENDLGLSMIETIKSSEMPKITEDALEVALDAILQDGILRDFPVINMITGTAKMILSFKDKILVRKLASFLFELQDITDKEREEFIHNMDKNQNEQRKVGENLIMLIERLDDLDKPALIAKIFKAYLRHDINYHQFLRFASVIDQIIMLDLKNFLDALLDKSGANHFAEYFYRFGLSRIKFDDANYVKEKKSLVGPPVRPAFSPYKVETPIHFKLNNMAFLLAQILLNQKVDDSDYIADNRKQLQIDADNKNAS